MTREGAIFLLRSVCLFHVVLVNKRDFFVFRLPESYRKNLEQFIKRRSFSGLHLS